MPVFALNGLFIYLFIYLFIFFGGGGRGGQLPFPSLLLPLLVHLCSSRQGITTGTCKTKAILADLDIFRHNQPYSRTSQLYLDIFRTLCNCVLYEMNAMIFLIPPMTQDVNWTNKRSQDVQFTSYVQDAGLN